MPVQQDLPPQVVPRAGTWIETRNIREELDG